MSQVWSHFNRGGSEKLVLLALADWANDDGGSLHPSMSTIARKTCVSESQARRIVHGFIAEGLLEVVGNASGGRPGTTPDYVLHLDRLTPSMDATPRADATPSAHARGRTDARDGLHGCKGTGSTHATQSIIEPPKNRHRGLGNALSSEFEQAWQLYPPRDGGNPKADAWKAWNARLRAGTAPADLIEGVRRYRAHLEARGKVGTAFVMQAARFFGPAEPFREAWPTAAPPSSPNSPDPTSAAFAGNVL
jgi:hypothetical protein